MENLKVEQITPVVQGLFEDYNGIPFFQYFGIKTAYETTGFWQSTGELLKGIFSVIWAASGINRLFTLMDLFSGDFAELNIFDKFLWYHFMVNAGPQGVVLRNWDYILKRQMASTAAAIQFKLFFSWSLFWRIIYSGFFEDAQEEMEEVNAKNLDYSLAQATAYHYWGDKEAQGLFTMFWVNYVTDTIQILLYGPLFLFYAPQYYLTQWTSFFFLPLILTWKVATPWKENDGETALMWWVDAIELGLYDPKDPPTNIFEIQDAREEYLNDIFEEDELSEYDNDDFEDED